MPNENKIRDVADAIKGIAEAVPVYQDVVQPAAREVGSALQTVAKTIHIALAPVSALVWGYDKIKDYLCQALAERLKDIPQERIVPPNPTVAGPAVEALRFSAHEPTLRELYANLLATSMDSKTAEEAHPSFVEILKQLTSDEARFLTHIYEQTSTIYPIISGSIVIWSDVTSCQYDLRNLSFLGQDSKCEYAHLTPSYIDNLCRLGIAEILPLDQATGASLDSVNSYDRLEGYAESLALEWRSKNIKGGGFAEEKIEEIDSQVLRQFLRLTALGKQFCEACISKRLTIG